MPSGWSSEREKARVSRQAALSKDPGLRFELSEVLVGADNFTLPYRGSTGWRSAEILFVNEEGLVYRRVAHYH
jgi:hypothetical protein